MTGVGFFDFDHGQDGLAFDCIEIHPVLKITIQGKQRYSIPETRSPRLRRLMQNIL